ncbi:alpha-2-macroglobulin family protein [Skermanella rosea]|uniref:alpha-2-macroglobulin family protein n=1 Tax=Skermanella rosea TaxID=1817965 RepID=UPI001931EDA6|nr:alpha-2-macroglobulin [Skermanella rosea]UEM04467.1 alpha-2-macroglobulin family protein [Skermanella rosea]
MRILRPFGLALAVALGCSTAAPAQQPAPEPIPETPPFGVAGVEVLAERDVPQACFTFTRPLEKSSPTDYAAQVEVEPPVRVTAVARGATLCLEGLDHGAGYGVTLKRGLPGAGGAALGEAARYDVAVPDRKPVLAFRGAGYVLPQVGAEGLPLRTVNVARARLQVLRIEDRSLVEQIHYGRISQALTELDVGGIVERSGTQVWQGEMAIGDRRNQAVVTPFPVEAVIGASGGALKPGVYLAVAGNADREGESWEAKATQWFVVSDLGLTTFAGEDGLLVFARSLTTAEPVPGVELRLLARSNAELGKLATGPDGIARFPREALRGTGGGAPQAVFAYGASGDMAFLDVAAATDPSERAGPGADASPLDAWLYTDRGFYQPGETVFLNALLRDAGAVAAEGRALTLKILRPDGFEVDRRQAADAGAGSYSLGLELPRPAAAGQWSVTAHLEPDGAPVGRVDFAVEDFVPPRLDVGLAADRDPVEAGGTLALRIDGRYRRAGPAAKLPGELAVTLRRAAEPYPRFAGYRFGLVQQPFEPLRTDAPGFVTGPDGVARVELRLPGPPDTSHALEAVIQGTLYDIGGRPAVREIVLPVRHQPFAIGIRPRFGGDAVPEGATATFDVVAVGPDGAPLDRPSLSYELYEEEYDYAWFEADGHWDYRAQVKDKRVTGGTLAVMAEPPADGRAAIEQPVGSGRYRLEVFDTGTGVATSLRFSAGWWVTPTAGERPDQVDVAVMLPKYSGGETAKVFVKPPYQAQVLVAVAGRAVHQTVLRRIGPEGAFLDIPVDPSWTAGVHVVATAFAPAEPAHGAASRRAVGSAWLAVDPAPRRLDVSIPAPADLAPRSRARVPVTVRGAEEGAQVRLTLSAVDDAMLRLTDFAAPDPAAHYLGRRPLEVDLRDVGGPLADRNGAMAATGTRPAMVPPVRRRPGDPPPPLRREMTALHSGIVTVGPDGTAEVPLEIPDFDGRLRLMAVAWTPGKVGSATATAAVRDSLLVEPGLPRFLAPDDVAQVTLTLTDRGQKGGDYALRFGTGGMVELRSGGEVALRGVRPGKPVTVPLTIAGTGVGAGLVRVEITGPDGVAVTREWAVGVRRLQPAVSRRRVELIEPGRKSAVSPDAVPEPVALRRETVGVMLAVGTMPDLDLPGLLLSLDRYPYGSAEQITSRAMPLLQLGPVMAALEIASEGEVRQRVQRAIDRLVSVQRSDGAFAMWSSQGPGELWLTSYALDFLGRARQAGYRVPETPWRKGIEWLNGVLDNAWFGDAELAARAYALYTLAGSKAVDPAEARYFQETHWDALPTRLARAQVAGALARLGDADRAAEAFARLDRARAEPAGMRDFGSELRDQAALIALLAEAGGGRDRLAGLAQQLATLLADAEATSTQERAWILNAAAALASKAGETKMVLDGQPVTVPGALYRRLLPGGPAMPLENAGAVPLYRSVTLAGVPASPLPADAEGFDIRRTVLGTDGAPVDPAGVAKGRVLVVILEGESLRREEHQALVVDMLPAGLEIENVRLADSGQLGDLSWLGALSAANHVEFRDDRFVAELDLTPDRPTFRLVYLARAVVPGDYALPGAFVEDMYSPNLFARGPAGRMVVREE